MTKILILGGGCARCEQLAKHTRNVVVELGIQAELCHVAEFDETIEFGVTKKVLNNDIPTNIEIYTLK